MSEPMPLSDFELGMVAKTYLHSKYDGEIIMPTVTLRQILATIDARDKRIAELERLVGAIRDRVTEVVVGHVAGRGVSVQIDGEIVLAYDIDNIIAKYAIARGEG